MLAKKTTIATAEKRQIKAEMKSLTSARKKILTDSIQAANAALKELRAAQRKHTAILNRIDKAVPRETAKITRRIAILEGRIHS